MSRFLDVYLDECVAGYGATTSPRWNTVISQVSSGAEQAVQMWSQPFLSFTMPDAVRNDETLHALWHHWMVMKGRAHTFPYRDPLDHASFDHSPTGMGNKDEQLIYQMVSPFDQLLGTGDGVNREFQLRRKYSAGQFEFWRKIYRPVVDTVQVAVEDEFGDMQPVVSGFSVDRMTGVVTFDVAPLSNRNVTAGFIYDVEVRFASDDAMNGVVQAYRAGGYAGIELEEVRSCG